METGLGRGRGRGRVPSQQQGTAPPSPPVVSQREETQEDAPQEAAFDLRYAHVRTPVAPDSERGRSRGRGAGRGRIIESGRGPGINVLPRGAEGSSRVPMQELEARFEDVEVGDRPESPKEVESPESPVEHSPLSVRVEHSPPPLPDMPGDINGTQILSATSQELGSNPLSSVKRVDDEPEEPVISRIGTNGESVGIRTNYLRLKMLEGHPGVVEYNVTFEPKSDSVGFRRKVLYTKECEAVLGTVRSFDGMSLFLPNILPNDVTFIETHMENDPPEQKIKVSVKFTKVRKMRDNVVFYNILLKNIMRTLKYTELRREYYDLDMITALDQHKLEVWPGLNLSSENQEDGLMICVDTCSRVLRQDTVYEHLKSLKGDPKMREKFENFIINKIVMTKYNHKCYKIDDVSWDIQPSMTFAYRGEEVNYVEYLKSKYPLKELINDMSQPMLMSKVKPRKNDKFAQEERIAALIPQCCYVTGLTEDQKANFKVMTDLAASTRLIPAQRIQNLNSFINRLLGNQEVGKILSDWGLRIERNIIDVMGRRVDGPNLDFNKRISLQKAGPDFSREAGKAVFDPIDVKEYVLICTQRDAATSKRFMETYQQVAGPLGIKMMQMGRIIVTKGMRPSDFSDALKTNCQPDKVQFVVIIMPGQRDDIYSAIKRYCVATVPVPSQCIVTKTLQNEKRLRSIVLKIALQINCKLGGSLWALRLPLKEEIMFIGIDAAHDPLKKDPSVICLVASLNNECTKYYSESTTSRVHQELGESLGPMTMDALKEYRRIRGRYPNRIVVFRDGGSVGAMDVIWSTEMAQMQKAATEICGEELKHFSFVLVTKRIAQRFFAMKARAVENPQPGTVVDSIVTRRHLYDYYVVSQQVRQGTVNPTHFVVMNKDDPIKPDLIQRLTYVTCFMYYNWSGTVRVPAMVQYAHKLSALLIRHVKATPHRDISTTLYYL